MTMRVAYSSAAGAGRVFIDSILPCNKTAASTARRWRVAPGAKGLPPAWWEVQNEHVGWGCVADAADAADGSWAETEQSDADRPMWVARAKCSPKRIFWFRDVSESRDESRRPARAALLVLFRQRASRELELLPANAAYTRDNTKRSVGDL